MRHILWFCILVNVGAVLCCETVQLPHIKMPASNLGVLGIHRGTRDM